MILWGSLLMAIPQEVVEETGLKKIAVVNFEQLTASTLSVGPVLPRRQDQSWLSKAIADLLIQNLSQVQSLTVLEREQMQAFSQEIGLGESGLVNQEKALRVGRVARVERVIFGNYLLHDSDITISIVLLDLNTQGVLQTQEITGPYQQLRPLVQRLVLSFLAGADIDLSESEEAKIRFKVTESITATEHFYQGIHLYDQGRYPEAFGEFLTAANQDNHFVEAHLWVGRLMEAQSLHRHAVRAYQRLSASFPQSVEGRDGLLFAAQILQFALAEEEEAIAVYRTLTRMRPATPHNVRASFELGDLLRQRGEHLEAYLQFKTVDDFRQSGGRYEPSDLTAKTRTSRFFAWPGALELYRESIVKMVSLYGELLEEADSEHLPSPPRGSLLIGAENPGYQEARYGHTKSLFTHESRYANWNERIYVVLVANGYSATGIDLSITGQMKKLAPGYDFAMRVVPFPLPQDFDKHSYGAILGQTRRKTTLRKSVSFSGERLGIFAIQVLENHSQISGWSFHVRLASETPAGGGEEIPVTVRSQEFWEGEPLARIPLEANRLAGLTRLQQQIYYRPKKEMDILHDPLQGYYLVVSQGNLDGRQTDLFLSRSRDGKEWSPPRRLDINASSQDFDPRLVRSEDGKIWLAWISTRRGKGWELMLSCLQENGRWASPRRVPLETFLDPGMENRQHRLEHVLLEYDIFQDHKGRWIVAYYSYPEHRLVVLSSSDAREWTLLSAIATGQVAHGAALVQDSTSVYRLGFLGEQGRLHLWSSRDGVRWSERNFAINFWSQGVTPGTTVHRMRLFPLPQGRLLMLLSDNQYGLQFARFHADSGEPVLDLVTRATMQPYSVTRVPNGRYVVALKEDEHITLRRYHKFNISGEEILKDARYWPIYRETEEDLEGNNWTRIFAQMRRVVSDVTSLGLEQNGRLWWGIETGIMYKEGQQFMATDVSQGFFYHLVTRIVSCSDERVWFSSKYLNRPQLGFVNSPPPIGKVAGPTHKPRSQTVWVPQLNGAVADLACGGPGSPILVASDQGKVVGFDGERISFQRALPGQPRVTALEYNRESEELWVGTEDHGLFLFQGREGGPYTHFNSLVSGGVSDLTIDRQGDLWMAVQDEGLWRYRQGSWEQFTPQNSDLLYWSVGHLAADPRQGVWYLPHGDVRSKGLGYLGVGGGRVFNPPHQILPSPSSIAVEPSGVIWIGTWYDGLYKMIRKEVAQ